MKKNFRLKPEEIKPLAQGCGACIATDMITVEGKKAGLMYRVKASRKHDSGWCFMCGSEPQAYLDDPKNLDIYDVNTIANYDPEIIPLLDALPGSAFARSGEGGPLLPAEFPGADE